MTTDVTSLIRPEILSIDGLAIRVARGDRNPALGAEALLLSPLAREPLCVRAVMATPCQARQPDCC